MKFIYTRPEDGGVSIVIAAPKSNIEKIKGPMTEDDYTAHVLERSIPPDAVNVRPLNDGDFPESREFRNAWVDVTPESRIDIDCEKARDLKLEYLRRIRAKKLEETDVLVTRAVEMGENLTELRAQRQALRDITNPLKALVVAGIVNDEALLAEIKQLAHVLD